MAFFGGRRVKVPELKNFDKSKYLGTWYEIARIDNGFERGLEQVTAHYAVDEKGVIRVLNRGFSVTKNKWREAHAVAVQQTVKNYFKVYFVPIFGGKYRVAYVDHTYSLAVVSGGTTAFLWLLARDKQISQEQKNTALQVAQQLGYDTSRLIYTTQ